GLTFRGPQVVALVADRPCYWRGGRFAVWRIDPARGRVLGTTPVPAIHQVLPTNLAFGDGRAFVAHPGGGVDSISLATGRTPGRTLQKGAGIVRASWLGGRLLALGRVVVDVRTWRTVLVAPDAVSVVSDGGELVAYGPNGAALYTRGGRLVGRLFQGEPVDSA